MKLLHIKSSLFGSGSVSNQLAEELIQALGEHTRIETHQIRDFSSEAVPYVDGAWLQALSTAAAERSEQQQQQVAYSDQLISELQTADTVVIGAAMYNFAIPATLKSWFDHVARAGTTFKYSAEGPVGLLTNKTVYVVVASGGIHEAADTDHLRPYLRTMLGFIGMTDVRFISAEGLNMGPEVREQGLTQARAQIAAISVALRDGAAA